MTQIKKNKKNINEKLIIDKYLKKLNFNKSSTFNFENDGAVIKVPKNKEIVVSHDTLVEKVHFFKNDSPQSIAAKAIRTNLSDLASMGAQPYAYSMSLSLTKNITKKWLDQFTKFLYKEQNRFNFYLLGGDIITSQYLSISITIFGLIKKGKCITRSGAKNNDDIWITGNIGDSYIGLKILKKNILTSNHKFKNHFLSSYYFPDPPISIIKKLAPLMNSAIDISDGFYGDLEKIILNSAKGANILIKSIPFSKYTNNFIENNLISLKEILTGGDDYQLIFTSNTVNRKKIVQLSKNYKCKLTNIGKVNRSKKIEFYPYKININTKNYIHTI